MKHSVTRELFQYWNALRGGRASPDRDQIDPAAIRHVLADTFLVEVRGDGSFPIRLSGTRFDAFWLRAQTGRCLLECWGDDRHSIAAALWTAMDGTVPVVIGAKGAPPGRPAVHVEGIFLPLRHCGKTHSRVLGALSVASPPPWIGLAAVERFRLVALRVMTDAAAVDLPAMRIAGDELPREIERRGHLTVYPGGREAREHASAVT